MNQALLKILQEARDTIDERRKDTFIESAIIMLEEEANKPKPAYNFRETSPYKPEIMDTSKKSSTDTWWKNNNITLL